MDTSRVEVRRSSACHLKIDGQSKIENCFLKESCANVSCTPKANGNTLMSNSIAYNDSPNSYATHSLFFNIY